MLVNQFNLANMNQPMKSVGWLLKSSLKLLVKYSMVFPHVFLDLFLLFFLPLFILVDPFFLIFVGKNPMVFPIHQAKINCESPDSTNGYLVTERSTVAQLFDVSVSCARGWEGTGCSHLVDVGPLVGRFPFSWGVAQNIPNGWFIMENPSTNGWLWCINWDTLGINGRYNGL